VIVLDTHALIWWVTSPKRIPREATRTIDKAIRREEHLGVSSFSIWEIAFIHARGRLRLSMELDLWLEKLEGLGTFSFYPVENRIARRAVTLPLATRDLADRIIVATAIEHGATLVTADEKIRSYETLKTVWD
jgi:PIN domain nuclease of toxin-antitoxin system